MLKIEENDDANLHYRTRVPKGMFVYQNHQEMTLDRELWTLNAMLARHATQELAANPDLFADDNRYAVRVNDEFTEGLLMAKQGVPPKDRGGRNELGALATRCFMTDVWERNIDSMA